MPALMPVIVVKDDRYKAGFSSRAAFDQYLTVQLTKYTLSKQ
jgi:hypothetical protein